MDVLIVYFIVLVFYPIVDAVDTILKQPQDTPVPITIG